MTNNGGEGAQGYPAGPSRRVIISGGASGIGRATARLLRAQGQSVVVLDIDDDAGRDLVAEGSEAAGSLRFVHADVSSEDATRTAIATALSALGGVDVLISAAGVMRGQLLDIAEHDIVTWDQVIDVNLRGAFLVTKMVAPAMVEQGRGVIILLASKAGVSVGSGSYSYGASKGGIHGLALTLDRHLGARGIRVNDVCPGDVDTPLFRRSIEEGVARGGDPIAAREILARLTPPEAVAEVLAYLASDAASAVRGTVFTA